MGNILGPLLVVFDPYKISLKSKHFSEEDSYWLLIWINN